MVTVFLIRHGHRVPGTDGPDVPLSSVGLQAVDKLAHSLAGCGVAPDLFLTSSYVHARRTAELVRDLVTPGAPIVEVASLTPHTPGDATLTSLISQTAAQFDLATLDCFACVGHEARIGQITKDLTGQTVLNLEFGTARRIVASSFEELSAGRAAIQGMPGAGQE